MTLKLAISRSRFTWIFSDFSNLFYFLLIFTCFAYLTLIILLKHTHIMTFPIWIPFTLWPIIYWMFSTITHTFIRSICFCIITVFYFIVTFYIIILFIILNCFIIFWCSFCYIITTFIRSCTIIISFFLWGRFLPFQSCFRLWYISI